MLNRELLTVLGFGANAGAVEVDQYGQLNFRSDHKPILEELRQAMPSRKKLYHVYILQAIKLP